MAFVVIFFGGIFISASNISAATLKLVPDSGTFAKGTTLNVEIYVNTKGERINAVQTDVFYPSDKLQFVGINTSGSVLEIFAEQYSTYNTVTISGGVPSPGFVGNKFIGSINFKVLQELGVASLNFGDNSVVLKN